MHGFNIDENALEDYDARNFYRQAHATLQSNTCMINVACMCEGCT